VAFEEASPYCGQNISTGFQEMALIVADGDSDTLAQQFTYKTYLPEAGIFS